MSMNTHVNRTVSCCFSILRQLRTVRRSVPTNVFQQLVVALVISRLDYGNATLYGLPMNQYKKLQSVMNSGAKLIFRAKKRDHVTPLLKELHWLKAPERICYKLAVLAFLCFKGMAPTYLSEELRFASSDRSRSRLRSASSNTMLIPRTRLSTIGDRAFPVAASRVWNSLPSDVTSLDSVQSFKSKLKTHFFRISYQ